MARGRPHGFSPPGRRRSGPGVRERARIDHVLQIVQGHGRQGDRTLLQERRAFRQSLQRHARRRTGDRRRAPCRNRRRIANDSLRRDADLAAPVDAKLIGLVAVDLYNLDIEHDLGGLSVIGRDQLLDHIEVSRVSRTWMVPRSLFATTVLISMDDFKISAMRSAFKVERWNVLK